MDSFLFTSYAVEERSYAAYIKREIHNLVRPVFTEQRTGEIDIVVSEMTSNLVKHAKRGELLYRLASESDQQVFEIICIDNGPGIKDISHSIKDGVSTKNTLGQGLGCISRLSNFSQIYSVLNWGTVMYAKFYLDSQFVLPKKEISIRCINLAKPGEMVSGDGVGIRLLAKHSLIFIGDGLGHGPQAKEATDKAILTFNQSMSSDPATLIRELNNGVKKTRGLVATIAVLDHEKKEWQLCGVGNISSRIQQGLEYKNYTPNNGIVGLNIPNRLENYTVKMEKLQQLIFCSDGLRAKWDLIKYPGILKYDPMIMAAVLYKDNARLTDDMTVLVIKAT